MAPETITVTCEGTAPVTAKPLAIPEYCDRTPVRPSCMQKDKPETSRFLDGLVNDSPWENLETELKKQAEKNREHRMSAISFAGFGREA